MKAIDVMEIIEDLGLDYEEVFGEYYECVKAIEEAIKQRDL